MFKMFKNLFARLKATCVWFSLDKLVSFILSFTSTVPLIRPNSHCLLAVSSRPRFPLVGSYLVPNLNNNTYVMY